MQSNLFQKMADRWPSTFIARSRVSEFTGGIIHPRTIANLDSQGKGPKGKIRVGRTVAYPVVEFVEWLKNRVSEA